KNRTTVTNYLRLLKLPPDIQIALRDNKISMGHARAIINIENPDSQLFIVKKVIAEDLSVRAVESLAREVAEGAKVKTETPETASVPKEVHQLQSKLSSHFGTKVIIKSDGKKGDIRIPFLSVEDLNRILDILKL
ncbi:MAG TPA: chromosome partitioning protein ParB, partial [Cytophagales bacterium]|nr:chromosome partitioning protein ParB [Cytophagales bacterium]